MFIRSYKKTYFALALIFWLLLTFCNLSFYFSENPIINPALADFLSNYLLCLFILFTFLFFKIEIGKQKSANLDDYLWKVFITGISTILLSLFIRFFVSTRLFENLILYSIFFHLNLGLITIFLASTFYVWKKLIVYHKDNHTNVTWHIFEYIILLSILSSFFIFDVRLINFYIYISPLIGLSIYLSFNLKWIALLNYKKKIRSIVLMAFILLITIIYSQQIYEHQLTNELSIDLWDNIFILGLL
ncbi:MAG TPA: hypothetical protein VK766_09585, partial [Cytophagaceae bacterium]|nr:hypothetical protein [Cytophagaceae bacterium]